MNLVSFQTKPSNTIQRWPGDGVRGHYWRSVIHRETAVSLRTALMVIYSLLFLSIYMCVCVCPRRDAALQSRAGAVRVYSRVPRGIIWMNEYECISEGKDSLQKSVDGIFFSSYLHVMPNKAVFNRCYRGNARSVDPRAPPAVRQRIHIHLCSDRFRTKCLNHFIKRFCHNFIWTCTTGLLNAWFWLVDERSKVCCYSSSWQVFTA